MGKEFSEVGRGDNEWGRVGQRWGERTGSGIELVRGGERGKRVR